MWVWLVKSHVIASHKAVRQPYEKVCQSIMSIFDNIQVNLRIAKTPYRCLLEILMEM